ncbi:MAG: (2Fe-2S) ferredoxin domain-containing protein [Candidatus Omnitrophica bacterium]|jgi:(2Fe-2S) ferredoxin|nr:(2Fe-2S) ferredoxin domain-containing protein [Candidatus Omnitrophota bacterium]
MANKLTKDAFEEMAKGLKAKKKPSKWIKIGTSTCGLAAGAEEVYNAMVEEIKKKGLDVEVKKCGCLGMCCVEPLVEVHVDGLPDVVYGKVDKEGAAKIVEKHICGGLLVKDHIYELNLKR